jgi:hypothetical protein
MTKRPHYSTAKGAPQMRGRDPIRDKRSSPPFGALREPMEAVTPPFRGRCDLLAAGQNVRRWSYYPIVRFCKHVARFKAERRFCYPIARISRVGSLEREILLPYSMISRGTTSSADGSITL